MRHPEAAPILRPSTYKQQSGVSWLSKTVQQKPSKTAPIQRQFYRNPIAIPQQPHKYTTLLPQQSHNNPKQRHSKVRHRRHTNPTAILHESQTITQQDRCTRKIPYSNCAVLTPQLHRAISQQSCKVLTVMPEGGHNNPATIDHAKCNFHIEI